ncbi:hypothetical protein ACGFNF_22035 [Micromonospora sp. NPDC048868]|uniref:hypothetical protein n=1 Tax=Micromonospora sp. NPDC048868 TaxID=3364258 RepID=UPI003714C3E2
MPQFPADQGGHPPQPPTSGAPQATGDPWAPLPPVPPQQPAGDPWAAPQPPVSGAPQPPVSGVPQPPVSGMPGEPWAAPHQPTSGTPYPPVSGTPGYPAAGPGYPPPGGPGYAPGGPGYPGGAPGYPLGPPHPVAPPKKNKTVLIVVAVVVVLALLCCVGGVVALVAGANKAANDLDRAAPRITLQPDGPSPSAREGETFNMKPGATLVVSDDDGTMEITVTRFTTETKGCRSYAPPPDKGMYLIAHVTATVTKGKSSINPFYFNWVAANGTTANGLASALSGCGDTLGSGNNLPEGSKRAGTVVFNVADKNGALEYQHRFQTTGSWRP